MRCLRYRPSEGPLYDQCNGRKLLFSALLNKENKQCTMHADRTTTDILLNSFHHIKRNLDFALFIV